MYAALEIEAFGESLFSTGDLDPAYIALCDAGLSTAQLSRWLLAYWCCYHVGASAWLSEQDGSDYWTALGRMAANDSAPPVGARWPRGRERRHFRGLRSVAAVRELERRFTHPEGVVDWLTSFQGSYESLRRDVVTLPLFGDWIAFKVGDMLERVCGVPVDFSDADLLMFSQPRQAAVLWWSRARGSTPESEAVAVRDAVSHLVEHFGHRSAPPRADRRVGLQEVETVLCKWKSHRGGHYPLGNDITELRHSLHEWVECCETAERLLQAMPPPVGRLF